MGARSKAASWGHEAAVTAAGRAAASVAGRGCAVQARRVTVGLRRSGGGARVVCQQRVQRMEKHGAVQQSWLYSVAGIVRAGVGAGAGARIKLKLGLKLGRPHELRTRPRYVRYRT